MLLCLFELLQLDSVRAELLHVWEVLLHTRDPYKAWHKSPKNVGIAVTDQHDGDLALGVEILQTLILQLRGIVNEEDYMASFILGNLRLNVNLINIFELLNVNILDAF